MPFCKELYRPLKIRVRGVDINGLLIVLYIFFIFKHLHTHSSEHNTHPISRPTNKLIHSIERKMANCCNGRECIWSKRTTIYNQSNTIQYNTTQHSLLFCSFCHNVNELAYIYIGISINIYIYIRIVFPCHSHWHTAKFHPSISIFWYPFYPDRSTKCNPSTKRLILYKFIIVLWQIYCIGALQIFTTTNFLIHTLSPTIRQIF